MSETVIRASEESDALGRVVIVMATVGIALTYLVFLRHCRLLCSCLALLLPHVPPKPVRQPPVRTKDETQRVLPTVRDRPALRRRRGDQLGAAHLQRADASKLAVVEQAVRTQHPQPQVLRGEGLVQEVLQPHLPGLGPPVLRRHPSVLLTCSVVSHISWARSTFRCRRRCCAWSR